MSTVGSLIGFEVPSLIQGCWKVGECLMGVYQVHHKTTETNGNLANEYPGKLM